MNYPCSLSVARANRGSQLDIDGLTITVTSAETGDKPKPKAKGKAARAEGTEILNGAKLRLKPGQRYCLYGRNGSGKSSMDQVQDVQPEAL